MVDLDQDEARGLFSPILIEFVLGALQHSFIVKLPSYIPRVLLPSSDSILGQVVSAFKKSIISYLKSRGPPP